MSTRTSLNQLFKLLRAGLLPHFPHLKSCRPVYEDFRPGDVRHSAADISKASRLLGYRPTHTLAQGLAEALAWYRQQEPERRASRLHTPQGQSRRQRSPAPSKAAVL